jgi:hypothetical protein
MGPTTISSCIVAPSLITSQPTLILSERLWVTVFLVCLCTAHSTNIRVIVNWRPGSERGPVYAYFDTEHFVIGVKLVDLIGRMFLGLILGCILPHPATVCRECFERTNHCICCNHSVFTRLRVWHTSSYNSPLLPFQQRNNSCCSPP